MSGLHPARARAGRLRNHGSRQLGPPSCVVAAQATRRPSEGSVPVVARRFPEPAGCDPRSTAGDVPEPQRLADARAGRRLAAARPWPIWALHLQPGVLNRRHPCQTLSRCWPATSRRPARCRNGALWAPAAGVGCLSCYQSRCLPLCAIKRLGPAHANHSARSHRGPAPLRCVARCSRERVDPRATGNCCCQCQCCCRRLRLRGVRSGKPSPSPPCIRPLLAPLSSACLPAVALESAPSRHSVECSRLPFPALRTVASRTGHQTVSCRLSGYRPAANASPP